MTAVIHLSHGVCIKLPVTFEPKHYSREESTEVLEEFVKKIGGSLLYVTTDEEDRLA